MSSKTKTTTTTKEATPALVPKLRFPEFRGAGGWAPEPMGEVYSFKGNNSLSRDKLNYVAGSVKNIHYGDIHTKFSTHFDITKELVPFINESEEGIVRDENLCAEGDMIFADASEDLADIGKCIEIVRLNGERVVSGLHTILARRIGERITLGFGGHLFKSGWVRTQIQKEAQGAKVLGISPTRLRNLRLPLPHDKAEQQKIAECLSSVDELMAAQARKVDALKTHKKGLMQQLFPREGETQPRLRFPEFQNAREWEKTTIGDLKPFVTSGSRGWAPFYSEQGELFVRITNLWRDSIYLDLTDSKFVQLPPGANEGVRTQLKKHDVLISITADIGIIGYVDESVPSPAYINQHIALVRFDEGQLCGKYVAYFLSSENSQRLFRASTDTGTKAGMSLIGINKIELMLPGLPEQHRLASCLSSLDALITAETQKLEVLKTHKKGLMQQLFPSTAELEA
jgi:type I restriction enzyme S subunit